MAGTTPGVMGWGCSDGETIDAVSTRWSTASKVDVVGGSTGLNSRGGIIPSGGTALKVTAQGTPNRSIALAPGTVIIPGNSATLPPAGGLTLTAAQNLATDPEHATLPRIDLVVARIINTGTSAASGDFFILTGTAAASPTRPTLPTGTSHCISLATITVQPATVRSVIQTGDISKVQSDTWTPDTCDCFYMAGPGGTVWMDGIMTMSNTRRQAWAALHAPGTRWLDITNKTEGYISNGECVPTTPKLVTDVRQSAGQVFTNSATPVNAVTTGAIAARPGGSRRIRVTMQGHLTTDTFGSGFNESVRLYLAGSGIPDVTSSIYSEIQQRLVSDTIGALSRVTVNATFEGTAAAGFQIDLNVLREGGNASAAWVYCEYGRLVVWDMGPA